MGKKRNVDADGHLLTGGLITGFLTFMGFLPGAGIAAAATGLAVAEDIQRAKKQEAFKQSEAVRIAKYKQRMQTWHTYSMREVDPVLSTLKRLRPETFELMNLREQLKSAPHVDMMFGSSDKNYNKGTITYRDKNGDRQEISYCRCWPLSDFKKRINEIKMEDMLVINVSYAPWFAVKIKEGDPNYLQYDYYLYRVDEDLPQDLEQKCKKYNLELRRYDSLEIDRISRRIMCEYCEGKYD